MRYRFFILFVLIFGALFFNSCYYDSEEYLYPQNFQCDTLDISYSEDIAAIVSVSCNSCHSGTNASGGINTSTYESLIDLIPEGELLGAIRHENEYQAMPQGAAKLPDCEIRKIEIWIENDFPNN